MTETQNSIRDKCEGKVWKAMQFMYDGLLKQSKRHDFQIDMMTFGSNNGDICFGCAATCTIQELTNTNLVLETIQRRAWGLNLCQDDLHNFEQAIDTFRQGSIYPLLTYFYGRDKAIEIYKKYKGDSVYMVTGSWREEMPKLESIIEHFKSKDI